MDAGTIIFAAISAAAAGASAIIAWVSRADTLTAARRAESAEKSALSSWETTAKSLARANELTEKHHLERLDRERRVRRVEVAEHFRRWYTEHAMRSALGMGTPSKSRKEKRELSIRLAATGEPGAFAFATSVIESVEGIAKGDVQGAVQAAAAMTNHVQRWVDDPEAYFESVRDSMTEEKIVTTLQGVVTAFEGIVDGTPDLGRTD